MRLTPVITIGQDAINETVSFYMGNNTPERRDYIMHNLTIDREAL